MLASASGATEHQRVLSCRDATPATPEGATNGLGRAMTHTRQFLGVLLNHTEHPECRTPPSRQQEEQESVLAATTRARRGPLRPWQA